MLLRPAEAIFLKTGWWNTNEQPLWPCSQRYSIKILNLSTPQSHLKKPYHYETPCRVKGECPLLLPLVSYTWGPILKFQFRCTACVSPWTTFCINTNPILSSIQLLTARLSCSVLMSIANNGFSIDLVNDRFSLRFKKSSYFESIFCCIFTPFFCISIIF